MSNQSQISQIQNNLSNLEKDFNNLKKEVKEIKTVIDPLKDLSNKFDMLINVLSTQNNNLNLNYSKNNILSNSQMSESLQSSSNMDYNNHFIDQSGSLNNNLNPFINIKPNNNIPQIFNANDLKPAKQKKKNYKPRHPYYYYYEIDGKLYKYIWENKDRKNNLKFNCTDTKSKAFGYYYIDLKEFKHNEYIPHIEYELYSYIIPKIAKEKYDKDLYVEEDFKILDLKTNTYSLNKKKIGEYFKQYFLDKEEIKPTSAIILFNRKFPNIDLTQLKSYISTKHREVQLIISEKYANSDKLSILKMKKEIIYLR